MSLGNIWRGVRRTDGDHRWLVTPAESKGKKIRARRSDAIHITPEQRKARKAAKAKRYHERKKQKKMSQPGLPPKPDNERVRRNAPRLESVPVKWDGIVRLPDLPDDYDWCPRTLKWWKTWQESPQSMVMTETDYEYMLETAFIHHKAFVDPDKLTAPYMTNLMAEIRRRLASYGGTWEARRKLAMSIESPQTEKEDEVLVEREAKLAVNYMEIVANKGTTK